MEKRSATFIKDMNKKLNFQPIVTIITMTLNAERFVKHTLNSVSGQYYQNIEYFVIDGGSTRDRQCKKNRKNYS